jgi:hypothetical protein
MSANVRVTSTQGNANHASPASPDSQKLLNLETFLLLAPSSRTVATLISVALVAAGVVLWWKRSGHSVQEDVSISLICAFGFAPLSCYLYITVITMPGY